MPTTTLRQPFRPVRARVMYAESALSALDPRTAWTALVLLAAGVPIAAGLWLDPRSILGAPAWLKPLKFALSGAIYLATLAWILPQFQTRTRIGRLAGDVSAGVLVGEVALISYQAWRGVPSHFNVTTPIDAVLFTVMGIGILVQTLAALAITVALFREPVGPPAMTWALRLGMALSLAGASVGGLMTRPTDAQLAEAARSGRMTLAGAHTVGAADGGAGLPGTGWSTTHGDLRVAHFVGLHAMQVLPVVAWLVRRRPRAWGVRVVMVSAAAYGMLFLATLVQALAGRPLIGG